MLKKLKYFFYYLFVAIKKTKYNNKYTPTLLIMSAISREASVRSICPFSRQTIYPGDRITCYTQEQHNAYVASIRSKLPCCLINAILSLGEGVPEKIGLWGLDAHTNWLAKKSLRGRPIKSVLKQQDRNFVAGSGFSGCDQYDRGYDRGKGAGIKPVNNHQDLKNFVVDDSEIEYDLSLQPDEELGNCQEEWDDDESSDDEDEWLASEDDSDDEGDCPSTCACSYCDTKDPTNWGYNKKGEYVYMSSDSDFEHDENDNNCMKEDEK